MSAAISTPVAEPDPQETTVHEWLEGVRANFDTSTLLDEHTSNTPTNLTGSVVATACAAAVDYLEIAANLEASGVSRQVATDRYGQSDVFALAGELWGTVPFRPVTVKQEPMWRAGNARDLGRGALYAAPALMLLALTRSLGVRFSWWSLPLAITWGWAIGQVTANAGYTLRSRRNTVGESVVCGWLMVATIASTAAFAIVAELLLGGGPASVLGATCVTTYMVSSAILLLNDREVMAGAMLAPAALVTVVILVFGTQSLPPFLVSIAIGGAAVATLAVATTHTRLGKLRSLQFVAGDLRVLSRHFAHGLICGGALTLVAILGGQVFKTSGSTALFALPLLLTLGVMEWQLRSFRSGVERLATTLVSLDEFAPRSWRLFTRSLTRYVLWTLAASVGVAVVVDLRHSSPPYALLGAQIVLGTAFFIDLTLVSLARLDLVMQCWLNGLAVGLLCAAVYPVATSASGTTVLWAAAVVATIVSLGSLLVAAPGVVSASMSH
jgi:hypothetical protein